MREAKKWIIDGEDLTVRELRTHKENIVGLKDMILRARLSAGDRSFERLFRPVDTKRSPVKRKRLGQTVRAAPVPDQDPPAITRALDTQVGGDHYKHLAIQPIEFCYKNDLNNLQSEAISYIVRAPLKGHTIMDIRKAIHTLEVWLALLPR